MKLDKLKQRVQKLYEGDFSREECCIIADVWAILEAEKQLELQATKEKTKLSNKEYTGNGSYDKSDPEVTCWHCKKTFLCDCMDATCRLCGAPYDKSRCKEFNFKVKDAG